MAETPIKNAVGAPPAKNDPDDVRTVQTLLGKVKPPLSVTVSVTGTADKATLSAIREFQKRFMSFPDGRVDPDGRTIWHLNDGFVTRYVACSAHRRRTLDRDIINAQKWLTETLGRISGTLDADIKIKIKNIFHIDADDTSQASRLATLVARYQRLRDSFDEEFPLQCEPETSVFGAWIVTGDSTGTMHFPLNYFQQPADVRTEKVIHERSHTVFSIGHGGMVAGGTADFGMAPDDDNGFTYDQAMDNAYCFGWLATAAQPGYVPPAPETIIVVPRPHPPK
jgi:hypothetical protein